MTSKHHIAVPALDPGGYTIHIGSDLLTSLLDRVSAQFPNAQPFIVTDKGLVEAGQLSRLRGGRNVDHFVITPAGEISKTMQTVTAILESMEAAFLGRDSVVIALGGGTVGDIAGFAAALFKRGVPVVQVPTTLLAQADSALGGKTGVDSSLSKNAFGAFWHPAAVYIDVQTLETVSDRDYRAGLIESVKHAMIADADYFAYLESHLDAILRREHDVLAEVALKNCRIKGHVVQVDPTERNMRRILNYGHTIGHAVETASEFELLHGEAIAIGLVGAGLIEVELGFGDSERLDRVRGLLKRIGVPVTLPRGIRPDRLIDLIRRDKKAVDRWPRFVLIDNFGQIHKQGKEYAVDVGKATVETVLARLYG